MRKPLNQFIKEMIINLLLVVLVIVAMIYGIFSVKIELNIVSIGFIVVFLLLVIHSFKSIKLGLLAAMDLIFKSTYEVKGHIQAQMPYECNCFSDKFDEERHICSAIRFCVVVKTKNRKNISLISQNYIDTPVGEECTLLVAKHSGFVISHRR